MGFIAFIERKCITVATWTFLKKQKFTCTFNRGKQIKSDQIKAIRIILLVGSFNYSHFQRTNCSIKGVLENPKAAKGGERNNHYFAMITIL